MDQTRGARSVLACGWQTEPRASTCLVRKCCPTGPTRAPPGGHWARVCICVDVAAACALSVSSLPLSSLRIKTSQRKAQLSHPRCLSCWASVRLWPERMWCVSSCLSTSLTHSLRSISARTTPSSPMIPKMSAKTGTGSYCASWTPALAWRLIIKWRR
jgi:hypothetical protein